MVDIRVPAHVQPFVTAIGIEPTVKFLLAFGGGYAYLSENPQERSPVAKEIGREATIALAREIGSGGISVPTAKPFIASHMKFNLGLTTNDIARQLHVTHATVRKWLQAGESKQLELFR
ncbi:hypothetical protein [Oryzifoliimicrobium ureilyticus]|uniref:hypothetical protein n=1 Tax=Oryzifoliimicrobium ureilyticus TaxID=3113724 RepID=UPI0030767A86